MSKIRHLKIEWRTIPSPSFVAEVVGRCNGACIRGTLHKEGGAVTLREDEVSTLSIGQSCYIFFAPAVRVFTSKILMPQVIIDMEEVGTGKEEAPGEATDSAKPISAQATSAKRFPKIWSKAIMDVFISLCVYELTKPALIEQFKRAHAAAVNSYFGESNPELETELWSNLKRFVSKSPFEFDSDSEVIKYDPLAVKPKSAPKKPRLGSDLEDMSGSVEVEEVPDAAVVIE